MYTCTTHILTNSQIELLKLECHWKRETMRKTFDIKKGKRSTNNRTVNIKIEQSIEISFSQKKNDSEILFLQVSLFNFALNSRFFCFDDVHFQSSSSNVCWSTKSTERTKIILILFHSITLNVFDSIVTSLFFIFIRFYFYSIKKFIKLNHFYIFLYETTMNHFQINRLL